jgi:hypothetical protein
MHLAEDVGHDGRSHRHDYQGLGPDGGAQRRIDEDILRGHQGAQQQHETAMVERQNAQGGEQRVVDADTVLRPDVDEHRAPVRHVVHGPEVEVVMVDKIDDR